MPCYQERSMLYEKISSNKNLFHDTIKEFEKYMKNEFKNVKIINYGYRVDFQVNMDQYVTIYKDTGNIVAPSKMLKHIHALKRINSSKAIAYMTGKTSIKSKFNVQKKNDTVILRRKA